MTKQVTISCKLVTFFSIIHRARIDKARFTIPRPGHPRREVADSTIRDFQIIVKQFYAWLYDIEDPRQEGYPKAVSWIHPKEPKTDLQASDLLTAGEVKKLISCTPDLRFKALIALCCECGLRVGEALKLKIGDVHLDENCITLSVRSEKDGPPRQAFAIKSFPLLTQWLDQHPSKENKEA